MITIDWIETLFGIEAFVPATDAMGKGGFEFLIESRPPYCDRGNYLVKIFNVGIFGHDNQDGFPRYYFSLDVAKAEMEAWVNKRTSCLRAEKERAKPTSSSTNPLS